MRTSVEADVAQGIGVLLVRFAVYYHLRLEVFGISCALKNVKQVLIALPRLIHHARRCIKCGLSTFSAYRRLAASASRAAALRLRSLILKVFKYLL